MREIGTSALVLGNVDRASRPAGLGGEGSALSNRSLDCRLQQTRLSLRPTEGRRLCCLRSSSERLSGSDSAAQVAVEVFVGVISKLESDCLLPDLVQVFTGFCG